MLRRGPRNLITDVDGILVGNVEDQRLRSGVSVVLCETPSVASVDVRGGAPGTRETDLLDPAARNERIDAICLSGGSAFGLSAAQRSLSTPARMLRRRTTSVTGTVNLADGDTLALNADRLLEPLERALAEIGLRADEG